MNPVIIIVLVIAVIIGIIALVWRAEKKRTEAFQALADKLGLSYAGKLGLYREFGGFKVFDEGHRRRCKNVIRGPYRDAEVFIGDYTYTVTRTRHTDEGTSRSSKSHTQTIFCVRHDELSLPHCFVRRQVALFDFLGKVFGGQDINYDEDPEFSKAFVLQGEDEAATRELFDTPELRRAFVAHKGNPIQFEAYDDAIVAHWGKKVDADVLEQKLDEIFAILDSIP